MKHLLAPLTLALTLTAGAALAECEKFPGGIALCDVPSTWNKSPNSSDADKATYFINAKTFAMLSYGPGAQTPTEAIEIAVQTVADSFNIDVSEIEQKNSGASDIDGISAVFVDYRVPIAGNWLFYRTTTAWSPNLTLRLTTYGFEHDLADDFDTLHRQLVAATKLVK